MRVMSFADYKLARYSSVSYDPWLFSPKLQSELAVWQNRHLLEQHPLFSPLTWRKADANVVELRVVNGCPLLTAGRNRELTSSEFPPLCGMMKQAFRLLS